MSKILYLCHRQKKTSTKVKNQIKDICEELNPDHITGNPATIFSSDGISYGISNPVSTIRTKNTSVLLGQLFQDQKDWNLPGKPSPDGNFALFRANKKEVEIITDCLGTRSIWYYFDEKVLIAATSQRAIITFLGDLHFDERVIPWMISTGSLGPNYSWDKRIKNIPGDGALLLDRENWKIKIDSTLVEFRVNTFSDKQHENNLKNTFQDLFTRINIDWQKVAITLSGGHDSRAILLLFKNFGNTGEKILRTLTWGEKKAEMDEEGDAFIASELSKKMNTNHEFFSSGLSAEPLEKIMNRFLMNGEGRIDHIAGYLDGFLIWKSLFENGFEGIIRGDEVFGFNKYYSSMMVTKFMGLTLCSEFSNLQKHEYIKNLEQELPNPLQQKPGESLATWRDRLFHMYRIPFIQSALSDLKYPYVEQINPFLSRQIVNLMRQLPDHLRTDKKMFKRVMKPMDPGIPFARRDSNGLIINILKQEELVKIIKTELSDAYAKTIFPENFLKEVIKDLKINRKQTKIKTKTLLEIAKESIPVNFKKFLLQNKTSMILDENTLGFRIFIICRMHKILNPAYKFEDHELKNFSENTLAKEHEVIQS